MRILVAGGAGFIGSHVCRALLARGHEVTCLDNLLTGRFRNIIDLKPHPRFSFLRSDVTQTPALRADIVLHLASPASPVHYQRYPLETALANSSGTHRLLDVAVQNGARFLFASTSEVYGDPLEHPQTESYWGNVNPIGPRACYDESKRFGEALTFAYRRAQAVNATIVRIFNTYGPAMNIDDGRVVPAFIGAALSGRPLPIHGDGHQTRSFCYVSDLVEGLLLIALDWDADGEVFNLGNPHEITILEFADSVARAAGGDGRRIHLAKSEDDPARRRPDIRRMRQRYSWEPKVELAEGLRQTVAYFRASPAAAALHPSGRAGEPAVVPAPN